MRCILYMFIVATLILARSTHAADISPDNAKESRGESADDSKKVNWLVEFSTPVVKILILLNKIKPFTNSEVLPAMLLEVPADNFVARLWATGMELGSLRYSREGGNIVTNADAGDDLGKNIRAWMNLSQTKKLYLAGYFVQATMHGVHKNDQERFRSLVLMVLTCAEVRNYQVNELIAARVVSSPDTISDTFKLCGLSTLAIIDAR